MRGFLENGRSDSVFGGNNGGGFNDRGVGGLEGFGKVGDGLGSKVGMYQDNGL